MKDVFHFIRDARRAFIELLDTLTLEQLNEIPTGFNNNIIWNFGHIVVSTQGLCYVRPGVRPDSSQISYLSAYAKGSKPSYFVDQAEVDALKGLALSTIEVIEQDYEANAFEGFQPFETSTYKSTLSSIEEVIITTAGHDNLHFGYAIAQKRLIK
ncbi:DinB family protein [Sphingobacterium sp. lm-10]|uniref:DinB family protein n=1 Tax=Sphingobacterium sp. lm-10 TaxID=2944904 RepID=UPI00202153FB|nr:DinB family protein [Sphingobacterium sp. lm-10]MCL7988048.1 DinB family protein [Sphingobacterium sp. lm-10]